jgi:hypothetical protein
MSESPFARILGMQQSEPVPMSDDAQAENLRQAWEHYLSPKNFVPGQLVRGHSLLNCFDGRPILMFVRTLDPLNAVDSQIIGDAISKTHCNKIDCLVMLRNVHGNIMFHSHDSDTLEPYPEGV